MSRLFLDNSLLIAKGGERACYVHPNDDTKVIKILYSNLDKHNNQNKLEFIYMNYLKKKKVDISYVTDCYGYIQTNLGEGLVFDRVLDYDGIPSKSFRYYLANKMISEELQQKLLDELKNNIQENLILFIDTSLTNIFCQKIADNQYKLIIVDGLGAKRLGIKFFLYRQSKIYTKYKIKRQWAKLMKMYNRDIIRARLGERPFTRL